MNSKDIQYIRMDKEVASICGGKDASMKQVIFNDAFASATEWYESTTIEECRYKKPKKIRVSCKGYIQDNAKFHKPVGFLQGIIFWFLAKLIIGWIIEKLADHIMRDIRDGKIEEEKEDPKNPDRII